MPKILTPVLVLLAASIATAHGQTSPCKILTLGPQDALVASPANHTLVYEDQDIRVLDVHSQPHTRESPHTHAMPGVMYIERQGAGTMNTPENPNGTSHPTDPNFKPRVIATKPQGIHWTENTGEVPFHAIRLELKHPGCGLAGWKPSAPGPDDPMVAAPDNHTLLYEDGDVRVLDVHMPAHSRDKYHVHPWPGVLYIAEAQPVKHFEKGATDGNLITFAPGIAHEIVPTKAEGHAAENVGDGPLHLIRFELKFATPKAP